MRMPGSRYVRRAHMITPDSQSKDVCVNTHPRSVRGVETDCVFLVYRNKDQSPPLGSPTPPQLEHLLREHI